jgi:hypothetical protein
VNATPAQALARYLRAEAVAAGSATLDWYVTVGSMPNARDNILTVYDTGGALDGRLHRIGKFVTHPGVNVRIRAVSYPLGWARGQMILAALERMRNSPVIVDAETVLMQAFTLTSDLASMGTEETNLRQHFSLNGTLTLKEA